MGKKMNRPQLTVLNLAIIAALTAMAPTLAAAQTVIMTDQTTRQHWLDGDFTVNPGVSIIVTDDVAVSEDSGGTIGTNDLTNNGTISGASGGIWNNNTINQLTNNGVISSHVDLQNGGSYGISNFGSSTINSLINSGAISGDMGGILNQGVIGSILNNLGGNISTLVNTNIGTISDIQNTGMIGTLDNSGILNSAASFGTSVINDGTITALENRTGGSIEGISNLGEIGTLDNSGTINSAFAVTNGGTENAIGVAGHIGNLNNSGVISSSLASGVINYSGVIGTLTNSGSISSSATNGIFNQTGSEITTLNNTATGVISGAMVGGFAVDGGNGIFNGGLITNLNNDGDIHGLNGISNGGPALVGAGSTGVVYVGTIGTLSNNGTINGRDSGIYNDGAIDVLTNNGAISGINTGIEIDVGTIGALTNNGVIGGVGVSGVGIFNNGRISTLTNSGAIGGVSIAISNLGTIGALVNSGTIVSTQYAIYNNVHGAIGMITNSGLIAGSITNVSSNVLSISGGAGTVFGTLTGLGSGNNIGDIGADNIGTIDNESSDLGFAAGNLLLNDNINVTGHTVTNAGATLQVNNTITITGNYAQNAGATLQIGVADGAVATGVVSADSGYGRLVISGSATFDAGSGVTLQKLNSYAFAKGQRFVVAQASDAHYNADQLKYSITGYRGTATGESVIDSDNSANTDLVLTVGAGDPVNAATNPNAAVALGGLFRYTGTNADMLNLFDAAAATADSGEANRAGEQLSPASTGAALVQSVQVATQAVIDVTSAHIDTVRVAQASGSGDSGVATGERPGDIAVWGQAFGGQANQNDRADASGYRADYNGMLIGADTALNDQWRAGGLFSYANTSISDSGNSSGSSGHVNSYGLTGYAGYAGEKWYLDLSASAVQQKYSTFRNVDFTGFSGGASGSFDGMQYSASAQAGYPIKLDAATTLTPIAGVTYSRLNQDGYTETGSVAALQIGSASTSSIKSDLGAKLERTFKTSYGDMTPLAQLSWRHEYRDTRLQSVGSFAADTTGTTSFTTQGVAPEKDTGVLVLGVTLARSQNLTLAAHYTLEAAGGYNAQTADVRLRYQF
jgi:outer membrane autotransporter protein